MRIFLDTSGLIALSDRKDSNHETARAYLEETVHKGARFVLGRNVLVEYIDGVTKRIGKKKALEELHNILNSKLLSSSLYHKWTGTWQLNTSGNTMTSRLILRIA